jgi:hypothetical protein
LIPGLWQHEAPGIVLRPDCSVSISLGFRGAYNVKVFGSLEVVHGTEMLDEHLAPRHAALIGFDLFDHVLDSSAVPLGPRGPQVLPVVFVLLSFDGKLGWVEGSLEHPLPFSRLKQL